MENDKLLGKEWDLWVACWNGKLKTVKTLLRQGVDINANYSVDRMKPIEMAVRFANLKLVDVLIEAGVIIDDEVYALSKEINETKRFVFSKVSDDVMIYERLTNTRRRQKLENLNE